jgi:DNA-directed RNA polymerase specialized sigma24 family protein
MSLVRPGDGQGTPRPGDESKVSFGEFSGARNPRRSNKKPASRALIEDARVLELLQKIVGGFRTDPASRQDMMQECLVCLWQGEEEKPGRTRSWYLQNCRFRVQHWLASGRSVDSPKRANGDKRIALDGVNDEPALSEYHTDGELFERISFHDVISTLASHLSPRERDVLAGLADGLALREVASKFKLSYPTALKYRRKIAALTVKLGITPVFVCSRTGKRRVRRHAKSNRR